MKLDQPYKREDFINFLKNDFLPDFQQDIRPVNNQSKTKTINSAEYLGECSELNLQVFEISTSGKSEKKVSQALDSFKILKEYQSYKALIAYESEDDPNWRFALLQMTPDVTEKGNITTNFSNPRRFSFLLGPNAKVKTPEKYIIKDGAIKDFEDLQRRFSVEVVNKDFYQEIARFFIRLVGGDTKLKSKAEHFKPELKLPSIDPGDHQTYQEFTVRLIGRIIFCWFLKQKQSEEGASLLPDEFLSSDAVLDNEGYYHSVLEPIFFEVLNKPKESRKSQFRNGYDKIPYLNGGLFDPHADDYYEGQPNYVLNIPDRWFSDLFNILETYNFTIDENTTLDVDLSIDPEMLGRIFENLLAEINPETGESARKSTGSYYTPRQIVEYMVDQSLIQYLITKTDIEEEKINALVSVDASDDEEHPLDDDEKKNVVNALDEVKIIDPACGSGAFPIGILQKIVWILGKVDTNGKLWFDKKLEGLDPLLHEDFKQKFENENFDYIRKTGVIRDSIYGVDIQPIAVEVSKLRSFLTLIVDEDIDESKDNRGIKPLPNLEFKFVAANTLITLPEANNKQVSMFEDTNEINELKKLRDLYFVSNGFEKERIKNKFKDVQREMFKNQVGKGGHGRLTMALADWDPFSNNSSEWFDEEWMFGINSFNIVIANPPYVNFANLPSRYRDIYRKLFSITKNKIDLYAYFIQRGDRLLDDQGILTYIIPHTWKAATSFSKLRQLIFSDFQLLKIADLDYDVFEATVKPVVILLKKSYKISYNISILDSDFKISSKLNSGEITKNNDYILDTSSSQEERDLYNKIETNSMSLEQVCKFTRGIKTSNDKKFVLKEKKNDDCKKVIRGRNITPYSYTWGGEYVWYRPDLMKEKVGCVPHSKDLFEVQEKLILQRISKGLCGFCDNSQLYALDTCLISDTKTLNTKYSLKYILALVNSKLLNLWYGKKFPLPTVSGYELHQLPIKSVSLSIQSEIESLVDIVMSSPDDKNAAINQLDIAIYNIYDLSETEIKIVEDYFKRKS